MIQNRRFSIANILLILALAAFLIVLGMSLTNYFTLGRLALAFPYPIDYGEGPLLDQVVRLAAGENIYHNNLSVPPFTISNYPPVYLLAQVPFYWLAGPAFWYGRLLSLLGALLTAVLIGLTLHTLTRDWLAAVIGGALLLAFPHVQFWSLLDRIDLLALVFSWAAIFVVVRWHERRWGIPVAALFFVLSIFTRQSYALAAPLGAFVWLLFNRQFRRAFTLAALTGGACLVLFLLINLLTGGGFFLNIVSANVNPFYWNTVRWNFADLTGNTKILLGLIAVFLLAERFVGRTRTWPLALAYLIGATLSGLTIGKDGSNVNYLLELTAALSFCAAAALAWMGRNAWLRVAVIAVLVLQVNTMAVWTRHGFNGRITEKTREEQGITRLLEVVKSTDGIIITDEYMGLLPLAGKRIYYQPFEFKMLAEGGLWDENLFIKSIENKAFSTIFQYQAPNWNSVESRWTRDMRKAMDKYYRRKNAAAYNWILVPKP